MNELIISAGGSIITALIAFLGAKYQANKEIQKSREQYIIDLEKVKHQTEMELKKLNFKLKVI